MLLFLLCFETVRAVFPTPVTMVPDDTQINAQPTYTFTAPNTNNDAAECYLFTLSDGFPIFITNTALESRDVCANNCDSVVAEYVSASSFRVNHAKLAAGESSFQITSGAFQNADVAGVFDYTVATYSSSACNGTPSNALGMTV